MKKTAATLALGLLCAFSGPLLAGEADGEKDVDALYHEGLNLLQNRSYAEAEEIFDRILQIEPAHTVARFCRGVSRLAQGRYAGAVEDFDVFLESKPGFPRALGNRGQALLGLARYDEALADLEEARRLEPSNPAWAYAGDQARMLKRGMESAGPGKPLPPIDLLAAGPDDASAPRRLDRGVLVDLVAATAGVERTLLGAKPYRGLVLFFLPGTILPNDLARLSEINEYLPALHERGLRAVVVAPDAPKELREVREGKGLAFPLLTDPEGRAAWQLGILNMRSPEEGRPLPTVIALDDRGVVVFRRTVLDPARRDPLEKVLQDLDRIYNRGASPETPEPGKNGGDSETNED